MSSGYTPPPPEHEGLPALLIAVVAAAWLGLVAVSLLAIHWWESESRPPESAGTPARMGETEIANVNQRPFALEDEAPRLLRRQRARLRTYGWVDRGAGVIHLPVEQAVEQVLAEEERQP